MTKYFFKYALVGFLGTGLDFLILFILVQYAHLYYLIASIISIFIVLWLSFSLNKYWTFQNKEKKFWQQFYKYCLSQAVALGTGLLILFFLVETFNLWYLWAKVISTAIAAVLNFLIIKRFIFFRGPGERLG